MTIASFGGFRALLLVGLFVAPSIAAAGPADGVAARGEVLAKRWCAECHVVTADQTRATSDAPSFFALTGEAARTPEALAAYLTLPDTVHSRMPDLALSRLEVADLVAYVGSLKK